VLKAVAIESNKSMACIAVGSARLTFIEAFRFEAEGPSPPGVEKVISGTGILGVGGAIGPGNAAKAG